MDRVPEKDLNEELSSAVDREDSSSNESESDSDSTDSSDSDSEIECTICNKKFSGAVPLRQHQKGSKHKKVLARKRKERKLLNKDGDEEEERQDLIVPAPYRVCKTCDKEFYGLEPYQMHLKSKAHKQKVLHASILEKAKENGEINVDKLRDLYLSKKASARKPSDVPDNGHASSSKADEENQDEPDKEDYECKDCDKTFCGLVPFAQHLTSKTHSRQVQRKKLLDKMASGNADETSLTVEDDILVCKVCSVSFSGPENGVAHLKSQKHAKVLEKYLKKLERKKKKAAKSKESDSDSAGSEASEERDERDANISEDS